ncbi:hypothetical protein ACQ4PT_066229 [Festuca glaucescens]
MDTDWRPMQGSNPPPASTRTPPTGVPSSSLRRATGSLETHPPVSRPMGLNELQRNAVRLEEEIYTAATNQVIWSTSVTP